MIGNREPYGLTEGIVNRESVIASERGLPSCCFLSIDKCSDLSRRSLLLVDAKSVGDAVSILCTADVGVRNDWSIRLGQTRCLERIGIH